MTPTFETYGLGEAVVLTEVIDRAELARGLDPVSGSVCTVRGCESVLRISAGVTSLTLGGDEGK